MGRINNPVKRAYELTFIVRLDTEDAMNETIAEVQGWVQADDLGNVTKVDRWGRRRLAYEIDKQREGYYVLFEAEIDAKNIAELERNLRLSTNVLRHLIVRSGE